MHEDQTSPAELNRQLFRRWKDARTDWENEARESIDFYLGNHYTQAESNSLRSVGQADFIIDRIYAAIEKLKSMLTARSPRFTVLAREDSDNKLANVWRTILEYIWDISDGSMHFRQSVHDYATAGCGYLYAYLDTDADMGRGEIKFTHINPFRVYPDPAARDRYLNDASGIILSTIVTEEQLISLYPKLVPVIDNLETYNMEEDYPGSGKRNSSKSFTPDIVKDYDLGEQKKYRIIERFYKVRVPFYRIIDMRSTTEKIVDEQSYKESENEIQDLVDAGVIKVVEVWQPRVRIDASIGGELLYTRLLNTDIYPIVPVPNIWTNTAYPKSDISKIRDEQRLLDKLFSLVLSHAQSSAGLKLLVPEGSVDDIGKLERDWANPNAVIEYNAEAGEPHFPSPQPLAAEFYHLIDRVEHYIDLSFGIPELLQGFRDAAPDTVRGTAMLGEFGESRGKAKLRDIEGSLTVLGRVLFNLAQGHYTYKKLFRVVQPNNNLNEFTVNNRLYDDKTQELTEIANDITIGQYDVKINSGSTLPSQRIQEYKMYLEAFQMGLVDDIEVLKKSEIFDVEGVLQRKSIMAQLQNEIKRLAEENKALKGDLQTAQREVSHSKQRVETAKFSADLDEILTDAKYNSKVEVDKLRSLIQDASQGEGARESVRTNDSGSAQRTSENPVQP